MSAMQSVGTAGGTDPTGPPAQIWLAEDLPMNLRLVPDRTRRRPRRPAVPTGPDVRPPA
ncbi:hypothetical protein [Streptomyces sp. NBC_01361]|uniref:hypothetical protein n=1 Tax=Streptomyces sp. NBC_01361 TaxID=2903838 RepID=UPI002E35622B|nr:hypothetical protein [Streptomyces sp. NBC_01361]